MALRERLERETGTLPVTAKIRRQSYVEVLENWLEMNIAYVQRGHSYFELFGRGKTAPAKTFFSRL